MKKLNATEVHAVETIRRYISEGTGYECKYSSYNYNGNTVFYSYAEDALVFVYRGNNLDYDAETEIQENGIKYYNKHLAHTTHFKMYVEQKGILLINNKPHRYIVAVAD